MPTEKGNIRISRALCFLNFKCSRASSDLGRVIGTFLFEAKGGFEPFMTAPGPALLLSHGGQVVFKTQGLGCHPVGNIRIYVSISPVNQASVVA